VANRGAVVIRNPRGHVTARDNRVLHTLHHDRDAGRAQATAGCRVARDIGSVERPLKAAALLAIETNGQNREAWEFVFGNAIRRRLRWPRKPDIGRSVLLFLKRALTLLLTQQLLRRRLLGDGPRAKRNRQSNGKRQLTGTMAFHSSRIPAFLDWVNG
jgi:hypothetical protein